jgi:hypothetical protein
MVLNELRFLIKHDLLLHRRDPERGLAGIYSLMIEGPLRQHRLGAQLGTDRHEWAGEDGGVRRRDQDWPALEAVAQVKRRREYRDL